VPEQQIGMHFIIFKENLNYTFIDLPKGAESHDVITTLMAKHFDIISTNELGNFFVTTNCLKKTWQDTGYVDKRYDAYTSHNLAKEL
jgi:hypothetical protein